MSINDRLQQAVKLTQDFVDSHKHPSGLQVINGPKAQLASYGELALQLLTIVKEKIGLGERQQAQKLLRSVMILVKSDKALKDYIALIVHDLEQDVRLVG